MSQLIAENRKLNVKMELSMMKLKVMTIFKVKKRQARHRGACRAPALRLQQIVWLTSSPIGLTASGANIAFAVAQSVQMRGRFQHLIGR